MKTDVLSIHPPANFNLPKGAIHAIPSYHIGYGLLHIASSLLSKGFKDGMNVIRTAVNIGISM